MPTLSDKKRAVSIAHEIEGQVSRYLFTITVINCCLGLAVGTTVGLLGLPNPAMWGAMVALLNFIPYLGALTGIVCMTLGAVLSFDSISYALLFPAFLSYPRQSRRELHYPMVMGRSLTLNPVLVLLSLPFGVGCGGSSGHYGRADSGCIQDFLQPHRADGAAGGIH
jgi:predicted PurR-regulated permease PerM